MKVNLLINFIRQHIYKVLNPTAITKYFIIVPDGVCAVSVLYK